MGVVHLGSKRVSKRVGIDIEVAVGQHLLYHLLFKSVGEVVIGGELGILG